MATRATDLTSAVNVFIPDTNRIHDIINGDATTEIPVENGFIPSIRKVYSDSLYFLSTVLPWVTEQEAFDPRQLYNFNGLLYWAPTATASNTVILGDSPVNNPQWNLAPIRWNYLQSVAISNNTTTDNVAILQNGVIDTEQGVNYFFDGNTGLVYEYKGEPLTGDITEIITVTESYIELTLDSTTYRMYPPEKIGGLEAVAISNNTTVDNVAFLSIGETLSGQEYLRVKDEEKTYYAQGGVSGTVSFFDSSVVTTEVGDYPFRALKTGDGGVPEWNPAQEYPTEGAQVVHNLRLWTRGPDWALGDEPGVAGETRWSKGVVASDLGTAADLDVTTSAIDTTAGRVLKVGDGGVLGTIVRSGVSLQNPSDPDGNYLYLNAIDAPPASGNSWFVKRTTILNFSSVDTVFLEATSLTSGRKFTSIRKNNLWESWEEIFSTRNTATSTTIDAGIDDDTPITSLGLYGSGYGFGLSQTDSDLTGSRNIGDTYTNSGKKAKLVEVIVFIDVDTTDVRMLRDGNFVDKFSSTAWSAYSAVTLKTIVQSGQTYSVTVPTGSVTIQQWRELG